MPQSRVFLDTNVIIECFRVGVWGELSRGHRLETVDVVVTEALTGRTSRPGRVPVDQTVLEAGLAQAAHQVTRKDRNQLILKYPKMANLDPGELNLFAYLEAHESPLSRLIIVSTADKGAIASMKEPGWLNHLVSLEELLQSANTAKSKVALLGTQYSAQWLSSVRAQVFLGAIP